MVILYIFVAVLILGIVLFVYNDRVQARKRGIDMSLQEIEDTKRLLDMQREYALDEALKQAELVDDQDTVEKIEEGTYKGPLPVISDGIYTSLYENLLIVKIAGMGYRGNLSAYEGEFRGVLVPEPKNDYDPNAIMIKCADGKHLGYIPEEITGMVRRLIGQDFKRHRIVGEIYEREYGERTVYSGHVYIAKDMTSE